jgi:hypothetical protein
MIFISDQPALCKDNIEKFYKPIMAVKPAGIGELITVL